MFVSAVDSGACVRVSGRYLGGGGSVAFFEVSFSWSEGCPYS